MLLILGVAGVGRCERIKDIVDIQGVRSNPLTGIGLVVGSGRHGGQDPAVAADADERAAGVGTGPVARRT